MTLVCQSKWLVKLLIENLTSHIILHRKESIRGIAGIVSSSVDANVDTVINLNGIDALFQILKMNNTVQMEQEILWALSNITAGTEGQIRAFLDDQTRLEVIFDLMDENN